MVAIVAIYCLTCQIINFLILLSVAVLDHFHHHVIAMTLDHNSLPAVHGFADQILDLPKGKLATLKTYLAMPVPPQIEDRPLPAGLHLEPLNAKDHARYRSLFAKIGENWLWFSRLLLDEAGLQKELACSGHHAYALVRTNPQNGMKCDVGLFEIHHTTGSHPNARTESELAFLGLAMRERGLGLGPVLIRKALHAACLEGATRLTVNTCQLDDPRALGFYQKMGFRIEKLALEILTDPRHLGLYPKDSAPHIPLAPL
jgi:ribosomal protein S18 acetylase RimI-like enzyme